MKKITLSYELLGNYVALNFTILVAVLYLVLA